VTWADASTVHGSHLLLVALDPGLADDEPARDLALHRVGDADDGPLGNIRVRSEDLLRAAGGQAVA
jgi:hypothetical protein